MFILTAIFVACKDEQSNEYRAHQVVSHYLDSNIYYPGNYIPVAFDRLKPFNQDTILHPDESMYNDEIKKLKVLNDSLTLAISKLPVENPNSYLNEQLSLNNKRINELKMVIQADVSSYNSLKDGWCIEHTYLAPNDFGTVIKQTNIFYLDKNLTRVAFVQSRLKKFPTWFLEIPVRYADYK